MHCMRIASMYVYICVYTCLCTWIQYYRYRHILTCMYRYNTVPVIECQCVNLVILVIVHIEVLLSYACALSVWYCALGYCEVCQVCVNVSRMLYYAIADPIAQ